MLNHRAEQPIRQTASHGVRWRREMYRPTPSDPLRTDARDFIGAEPQGYFPICRDSRSHCRTHFSESAVESQVGHCVRALARRHFLRRFELTETRDLGR